MTEIHGVTGAPYKTPQVRRAIPTPHERPRIDLDGARRVKRVWQDKSVVDIKAGDTVSGFGVVDSVKEFITVPEADQMADYAGTWTSWRMRLINVLGYYRDYEGSDRVFAFAPEPQR